MDTAEQDVTNTNKHPQGKDDANKLNQQNWNEYRKTGFTEHQA
jgi:hypothetical protein